MTESDEEVSNLTKKEKQDLTSTRKAPSTKSKDPKKLERKDRQNARQNRTRERNERQNARQTCTDLKERKQKDRQNARKNRIFIRNSTSLPVDKNDKTSISNKTDPKECERKERQNNRLARIFLRNSGNLEEQKASSSKSKGPKKLERKDRQSARQHRARERNERQDARQSHTDLQAREQNKRQRARQNRIRMRHSGNEEENERNTISNNDDSEANNTLQIPRVESMSDADDYSESSYHDIEEELEDDDEEEHVSMEEEDELPTARPVDETAEDPISDEYRVATRRRIIDKIREETTVVAREMNQDEDYGRRKHIIFIISSFSVVLAIGIILGILLPSNKQEQNIQVTTVKPTFSNLAYLEEYLWPISGDKIYDNSSAQYQTLQWLAYEDMQVSMIDDLKLIEIPPLIQRYVVALLYFSTNGPEWLHHLNFLSNSSICEWRRVTSEESISSNAVYSGIHCDNRGVIDGIILVANNLNGTIPLEITTLTNLEDISIYGNNLYGKIPSMINSLTRLEYLQVQSNFLTGSIPDSLIDLSNLAFFDMKYNRLNGTIPSDLTYLGSLKFLDLSNNQLSGTIPEFRVGQNKLVSLFLRSNKLTGTIPVSFVSLTNLETLALNDNYFTGSISSEIGMMEKLVYLQMSFNELTGLIPTSIGRLERLRYLNVGHNLLSGRVPTELGQLTMLDAEVLSNNALTGPIPSEIGQSFRLIMFTIDNNIVTGTLPATFKYIPFIVWLVVSNTDITGSLDSIVCSDNILDNKVLTSADCGGPTHKVECTCCTECCDHGTSECEVNLDLSLDMLEFKAIQLFGWDADCAHPNTNMYNYTCMNHNCIACNEEGSICGTHNNFGADQDYKNDYITENSFTYHSGERNETIKWREQYMTFCEVWVNGEQCNNCLLHFCRNGYMGRYIDCMNVIDGDDGIYDTCHSYQNGGVFDYFSWWDLQSWTGCRIAVHADYTEYDVTEQRV